jgi:hypothetical protein
VINVPAWCAEAWTAVQTLRRLGFSADDIFFGCQPVKDRDGVTKQAILVQLKRGEKDFAWVLEPYDGDAAEAEATWREFAGEMNNATYAELQAVWDSSHIVRNGGPGYLMIASVLMSKGIDVPKFQEIGL